VWSRKFLSEIGTELPVHLAAQRLLGPEGGQASSDGPRARALCVGEARGGTCAAQVWCAGVGNSSAPTTQLGIEAAPRASLVSPLCCVCRGK
jgi:hypothetical protein